MINKINELYKVWNLNLKSLSKNKEFNRDLISERIFSKFQL